MQKIFWPHLELREKMLAGLGGFNAAALPAFPGVPCLPVILQLPKVFVLAPQHPARAWPSSEHPGYQTLSILSILSNCFTEVSLTQSLLTSKSRVDSIICQVYSLKNILAAAFLKNTALIQDMNQVVRMPSSEACDQRDIRGRKGSVLPYRAPPCMWRWP